jgi:peptide chain release factor 1
LDGVPSMLMTFVGFGDVVDQLHDDHGLADAGAAEQADLAAARIRREQIDDLDAGDQDLRLGRLVDERGRRLVDRRHHLGVDRAALVDRLADHVDDAAERLGPDRHHDRAAGVDRLGAAHQAVGRVHRDRAHRALAQVLRDLEHQGLALVLDVQRRQDLGQVAVELHVADGADDLGDAADIVLRHFRALSSGKIRPLRRRR